MRKVVFLKNERKERTEKLNRIQKVKSEKLRSNNWREEIQMERKRGREKSKRNYWARDETRVKFEIRQLAFWIFSWLPLSQYTFECMLRKLTSDAEICLLRSAINKRVSNRHIWRNAELYFTNYFLY